MKINLLIKILQGISSDLYGGIAIQVSLLVYIHGKFTGAVDIARDRVAVQQLIEGKLKKYSFVATAGRSLSH